MRAIERRLDRVEAVYGAPGAPQKGMRWIISALGRKLNWETSHCTRRLCANGLLMEVAFIDGDVNGNGVTGDQIDRFVERFSIEGGGFKGDGGAFAAAVAGSGERFRGDRGA